MTRRGKILVSHPKLPLDNPFHKTAIYMYQDDQNGSVGVCLNRQSAIPVRHIAEDKGIIFDRGVDTNAAFIWDESTDSFVAGTTATDGSASSNLTVTEATLKAATQSQSDNSTKVATTAYVDTAVGNLSSNSIADADNDTKIQVEEGSDEDIIR